MTRPELRTYRLIENPGDPIIIQTEDAVAASEFYTWAVEVCEKGPDWGEDATAVIVETKITASFPRMFADGYGAFVCTLLANLFANIKLVFIHEDHSDECATADYAFVDAMSMVDSLFVNERMHTR